MIYKVKTKPYPHQVEAINFLINNFNVAVFDEQGVGKTKEIVDSLVYKISNKVIDAALIICPNTLKKTWEDEIKTHSNLLPVLLYGSSKNLRYKFLINANCFVINYDSVASELQLLKLLLKSKRFELILDESQKIKNPNTKIFKTIEIFKDLAINRVILTGTPVANNVKDLWAQFYFLDNGSTLGSDYNLFSKKYAEPTDEELRELNSRIAKKSIRRLKENVLKLPGKTFISTMVEMTGQQLEIYKKLRDELEIVIAKEKDDFIIDESSNLFKKILRMIQIASNPALIVNDYTETPAKYEALDSIIEKIIQKNEKAIIWSSFVGNIISLKKRYESHGTLAIHGSVSIEDRSRFIKLFQNDNNYKIMVANPAAAKEGITLTSANNAIYLDRNFNLVDYLQSQDRIHRISQTKECSIIKLIASNSIDLLVEDKLNIKQSIAAVAQGDTYSARINAQLTKEEIMEILKL